MGEETGDGGLLPQEGWGLRPFVVSALTLTVIASAVLITSTSMSEKNQSIKILKVQNIISSPLKIYFFAMKRKKVVNFNWNLCCRKKKRMRD